MTKFQEESRRFLAEVDAEAAWLVREGVPPWAAIEQAREIVSERRQRKSWKRWEREVGIGDPQ